MLQKNLSKFILLVSGILLITHLYSCRDSCNRNESRDLHTSLDQYSLKFIDDLTSHDWANLCKINYGWTDDWIAEHQIFRDAFPDYNIKVKRLLIDSIDVIIWGEVSGTHMKEFPIGELKGHQPKGKKVTWSEVWYFDIINDSLGIRFGEKFDMITDGVGRMKQLGIKCLPEE